MTYKVQLYNQVYKKLKSLTPSEKTRIAEKIYWLGDDPNDVRLDVKKLEGAHEYYRLRIGDWRLIFKRQDSIKIITIEKLKSRGEIYK